MLRGKYLTIQAYLKKQEKHQINNLTLHLKKLEKEEPKTLKLVVVQLLSCVYLQPHGLQHAKASLFFTISRSLLKLKSIELVMSSNHLILCHHLLLLPSIFPSIRVFSNEWALHIRWPKYWSLTFSITHSNEYSQLISFRIDWFDLLAVCSRDSQESSPAPQFKSINSSVLSLLCGPTLTSIHDYWKNHSLDLTDVCWQSDISVLYYAL